MAAGAARRALDASISRTIRRPVFDVRRLHLPARRLIGILASCCLAATVAAADPLTGLPYLAEAEAAVVRPSENSRFEVVARIPAEQWEQLAQ
jgi:hypothetical protein